MYIENILRLMGWDDHYSSFRCATILNNKRMIRQKLQSTYDIREDCWSLTARMRDIFLLFIPLFPSQNLFGLRGKSGVVKQFPTSQGMHIKCCHPMVVLVAMFHGNLHTSNKCFWHSYIRVCHETI
jgi:hypothetical protein